MTADDMVAINADRLLSNLEKLRSFGATGNGVVRTSSSDTDLAARGWLAEQMNAAGLDATIDGVSHDFAEDSTAADIVLGAQALADATVGVARRLS